jgi:predicted transposase YbfD/YdcC
VPADPSFPIPSGLTPLRDADPLQQAETPHLLAYLATIPRGHRHPLIAILAMAAAAVLAGARSMTAIAEWAADTPQSVRAALGARRESPDHYSVPAETTIRRALGRLDPQALATAIGAWLGDRNRPQQGRQAIAVDGKTLRGAKRDGRQVHLLAAMDHTTRTVLAQRQVDGAPGEVPAFQPLLNGLDLAGAVITADALHTHADAAEFLVTGKQAHYLFVVKANQPTLLERCAALAWHNVPVADRTRDRGHGRIEIRTLKAVSVRHFGFPHAAQVLQVTRKVCDLATRKWHTVVVYAISSLSFQQARPARLADLIRRHWSIENGLHWVRDVTFAEDASQLRTGTAPQVMSSLRNLAIGVLSRAGPVNLAAALRRHARDPARPLATLGISLV